VKGLGGSLANCQLGSSRLRKRNEWNLLRDQFDALVHNEGVREDSLEQLLDGLIRRRFGELISWAASHQRDYGARLPDPDRTSR
jgi:hypothetical protein